MKKRINILSIDGGGIRGILPAVFLAGLEGRIQEITKNADARLVHYFDFFAGTSIGGLLSCVYLTPEENNPLATKYSAKQAPDFYFTYANSAFKPREQQGTEDSFHRYSPTGLEAQLKLLFKDLKCSELIKPCSITAYNLSTMAPYSFSSYAARSNKEADFLLRDALLATSALPGIFPPASISNLNGTSSTFIDGSIFAHNPAFYAYLQTRKLFSDAENFLVLSLGTGYVPSLSRDLQVSNTSDKNWARLLSELCFGNFTGTTDLQFEDAFRDKPNSSYIRLQPSLDGLNTQPDDVSPINIKALYSRGQEFLTQNNNLLSEIAESLIKTANS